MTQAQRPEPMRADPREIRFDQVRLLARNVPVIVIANLLNSLLTVAFFGDVAPPWVLGAWLMLTVALSAIGSCVWWARRDESFWRDVDASVIRRITLCAGLGGGLWGLFALIVFPPESLSHQVLLALVVGSTAAASLVSLQSIPLASAGYILLSLAPLIVAFGRVGDPLHWFMTEMLAAFAVVLIALSHNSYATFLEGVRLRVANADLLERTAVANETLKRNVGELEWSRHRLIKQANELKKLAQTSTQERRKAEAANLAKSTFLANMSHELRTPLSAIIGFSEMMQREALGPVGSTRYRAYADDINRSGMHLLGLVNDLLDLSKIEAGKMELMEDLVDVGQLIADCMTLVRDAAARAGIELAVDRDQSLPVVFADERKLKQILINLLSNAIKFTGSGGSVEIVVAVAASGGLEISVRDSGVGIRPEDIAKVMEPFGQLRSSIESGQPGTGLGLPLSRKLAELHGGTLEIESAPGRGTTVLLSLPPERVSAGRAEGSAAAIAVA
ncbi:MAG TPA: ATP-binding protein [Stellaceae bacterium]|nr:ATP-binding protein [Stellaceae bacterium]